MTASQITENPSLQIADEQTPLLHNDIQHDISKKKEYDVYDRFTKSQRWFITALIAFAGLSPCKLLSQDVPFVLIVIHTREQCLYRDLSFRLSHKLRRIWVQPEKLSSELLDRLFSHIPTWRLKQLP